MISMKQYVNLAFFIILVLGLSACGPPSGSLSMALNLQENDTFKMELELREIIEQQIFDEKTVEVTINRWELGFDVLSIADSAITLEIEIADISYISEGLEEILTPNQMEILIGQSFELVLSQTGEVFAVNGIEAIGAHFNEQYDFIALMEEMGRGGFPSDGEDLDANSERVERMKREFSPILAMIFDMMLGEELMHDLLSNVFAANNDKRVQQGTRWASKKIVNRAYTLRQPSTSQMKLELVSDNQATVAIDSESSSDQPQSLFDQYGMQSAYGMDVQLLELETTGLGEVLIDLNSGWPQRGRIDFESKGIARVEFSDEWIQLMHSRSDKIPSEIEAQIEKLKRNPVGGEVTFEFKILD